MRTLRDDTRSTRRKINRTDLAYAAGIIDGEGCITAMWNSAGGNRYPTVRVDVTNTNYELLEWFKDRFGGGIYVKKKCLGTKNIWSWRLGANEIKWFLKLMIPFLRIKSRQARLALVLRHMILVGSSLERKTKILQGIQWLNSGVKIESSLPSDRKISLYTGTEGKG